MCNFVGLFVGNRSTCQTICVRSIKVIPKNYVQHFENNPTNICRVILCWTQCQPTIMENVCHT